MIVWLNGGYEGGETHFPAANLKLKGAPGDAGEKLLASRWIRARPFEG